MSATNSQDRKLINFLWVGLFFSLAYWVLESVRDVVTFGWGTLIERLFTPDAMSLWMRVVVVCMIMMFSAIIQNMRTKAEAKEKNLDFLSRGSVILLSFGFGVIYWVLEAFRDVVVYHRGTLIQQIFSPDPVAFWMRLLAICILVLFGVYVKTVVQERIQAEEALKRIQSKQIREFENRIESLEAQNALNEKTVGSLQWQEKELRELLNKKERMIRNVHQSVRNNLQRLNSLFDARIIQADSAHKEVYYEIRSLLYTLIVLHSQLHKSNQWNQVILADYMKDIANFLSHYYQIDEIRFHMDNAHIMIPISQAVPFAFTMCEIVFLANKKREMNRTLDLFNVLIKRTDDDALSVKIRHKDDNMLPDIEQENGPAEYIWLREIIDQQLHGDFWVVRSAKGIELNIVFNINVMQ
jgi:two-component sensor histidine kinase